MSTRFLAGCRVMVSPDFFWAKGAIGTISSPPREVTALSGPWQGGLTRQEVSALLLVLAWSAINLNLLPYVRPFDPFPFGILALIISSESVLLTIFVLISQNRMARQAERRAHLDLQVGMLAEQELTTMLQMMQGLCEHAGVDVKSTKQQVEGFTETTDVHKLASELEKLPEQ
jgi:uncharacterized membrane protein